MSVENNTEEVIDWKDKYIHLAADFDNFRKNTQKDMASARFNAEKNIILEIIDNIDEIDTAYKNSSDKDGFRIVYHNLLATLERHGVEQYGEEEDEFDSNIHEAIAISSNGEVEKNHISHIIKYGYKLDGRIIRHAQVIVEL